VQGAHGTDGDAGASGRPRVVVYYPSFGTVGGAERQALLTALALADRYDVELCGEELPSAAHVRDAFDIDLAGVAMAELSVGPWARRIVGANPGGRRWRQDVVRWSHARALARRPADVLFRIEHLPPPPLTHGRGVFSCLFPFADETNEFEGGFAVRAYREACKLLERALFGDEQRALATWTRFAANSGYTASWMRRLWGVNAEVVWPPCDDIGTGGEKQPWLLSVGRFEPAVKGRHSKSQDVLIDAFRALRSHYDGPCELHLAGHVGTGNGDRAYLDGLKERAAGLPVHFHTSVDRAEIVRLYRQASLFWLATGTGFDPERYPGKQEHFGIATVEAMSAGAVPIVRRSGGSVEILGDGGFGALWETPDELVAASIGLLRDPRRRSREADLAVARARDFGADVFAGKVRGLVAAVLDEGAEGPRTTTRRVPLRFRGVGPRARKTAQRPGAAGAVS
jgi:glycosyltransferase involved in cell wall biosynthesis